MNPFEPFKNYGKVPKTLNYVDPAEPLNDYGKELKRGSDYMSCLASTNNEYGQYPDNLEVKVKSSFMQPVRRSLENMFDGKEKQYASAGNLQKLEEQLRGTPFEIKDYQNLVRKVRQGGKNFWKIEDFRNDCTIYDLFLENLNLVVKYAQNGLEISIEGANKTVRYFIHSNGQPFLLETKSTNKCKIQLELKYYEMRVKLPVEQEKNRKYACNFGSELIPLILPKNNFLRNNDDNNSVLRQNLFQVLQSARLNINVLSEFYEGKK